MLFQEFISATFIFSEVQLHIFDLPFGFYALELISHVKKFFFSQPWVKQLRRHVDLYVDDVNVVRLRKCHVLGHIFL